MSELRVLACAVLLAAGVAAAVAAGFAHYAPQPPDTRAGEPPGIASVRLAELVAGHAAQAARDGAGTQETGAATRAWALALQAALARVAREHRAVLLPARAVAAGAPDLTGDVEAALAEALARPAAGPESGR